MEINPFVSYKILTCYEKIDKILSGEMPVPRTLELFVSDRCNHSCVGCHSKVLHSLPFDFLKLTIIRRLLREVSEMGVKGIEISGGGEPLMHPQITDIVKCARGNNLKVGIFTNGVLLEKKLINQFVSELLFIRIAFNSANADLYKRIHGKDDLGKVLDNIKKLVSEKKSRKSQITIGLKMLVSQFNYSEVINAAKTAKLLGADYIQFKALRKSSLAIPDTMAIFVKESIEEAKRLFCDEKFKILGSVDKTDINRRCFLNPLHPVVDASGNVYLCAFFQHRMDSHCIGNLNQASFKKIWHSKRHRSAFENNDYRNCKHFDCPLQIPVEFVENSIIDDKIHAEFI